MEPVPEELVLRVNQLDSTELDGELYDLLQHQFLEVFKYLPSIHLLRFKPELKLILMLDLRYGTRGSQPLGSRQKMALFAVLVVAEWLQERFDLLSLVLPLSPARLERLLQAIVTLFKTLSLFNFLVFLVGGCYPSLKERLLSLTMVPIQQQVLRTTNYDYMNREILWHGFSEAIFFVLPHFNIFALKNWWRKWLLSNTETHATDCSRCSLCEEEPSMGHVTNCNHVYCYYCLKGNIIADSAFCCSVCGTPVQECRPIGTNFTS